MLQHINIAVCTQYGILNQVPDNLKAVHKGEI